jgi:hypothetical protein
MGGRGISAVLAVLAALAAGPAARVQAADFQWSTGQGSYNVAPGQSLTVPLYLIAVTQAGETTLVSANGLFSAGLSVHPIAPGSGTAAAITTVQPNAASFANVDVAEVGSLNSGPPFARLNESHDLASSGASGLDSGSAVPRVTVGSLTIGAGSAGNVTSLQIGDFVDAMDHLATTQDTVTGSGGPIDSQIAPGTFSVSTTPEPSGIGLLLGGGVALLGRRTRAIRR